MKGRGACGVTLLGPLGVRQPVAEAAKSSRGLAASRGADIRLLRRALSSDDSKELSSGGSASLIRIKFRRARQNPVEWSMASLFRNSRNFS